MLGTRRYSFRDIFDKNIPIGRYLMINSIKGDFYLYSLINETIFVFKFPTTTVALRILWADN